MDRTLNLTLKKKWFDMILSGEKQEEYREIKPYWVSRLVGKKYKFVKFTNGYGAHRPSFTIELKGIFRRHGHLAWGAPIEMVFVIKLGKIIKT